MPFGTYSATPSANTSIAGNNISEGGPPSAINNAIRQIMADARLFSDSIPPTQALATQAILASATVGVYPTAAGSNIPRGMLQAGVGTITPGTTGTNGTFPVTWTGGNFLINPSATFTVAGGVLTAFTVTGPGLHIGATATVPTPSFAASTGLTGAAVALTADFLIASGIGYWVARAGGEWLDRYTNNSGVATATPSVTSIYVGDLSGVATVAANIAAVTTVSTNIAAINAAPAAATGAAASAQLAADWAEKATPPAGDGTKSAKTWAGAAQAAAAELGSAATLTTVLDSGTVTEIAGDTIVNRPKRVVAKANFGALTGGSPDVYANGDPFIIPYSSVVPGLPSAVAGGDNRLFEVRIPAGVQITGSGAKIAIYLVNPSAPLSYTDAGSQPFYSSGVDAARGPRLVGTWDLSAFPTGILTRELLFTPATPLSVQPGDMLGFGAVNVNLPMSISNGPSGAYAGNGYAVVGITGGDPSTAIEAINSGNPLFLYFGQDSSRRILYTALVASGPVRVGMTGPSATVTTGADGQLADMRVLGAVADAPAQITSLAARVTTAETAITNLGGNTGPKGDAQHIRDYAANVVIGAHVVGDNTVTTLTDRFSSADIGKTIWVTHADGGGLPRGTITAILAGNKVRVSTNWTLSGNGSRVELVWGSNDTSALTDLWGQTLKTAIFRPAPGSFIFTAPFADWRSQGTRGLAFIGAGMDAMNFFASPDFDFSLISGQQYRSMLVMASGQSPFERATFSGFSMFGPMAGYSQKPANTSALVNVWNEALIENVHVQSFAGLDAAIESRGSVTLKHVRSKQHSTLGTIGFRCIGADVNAFDLHTGNCSGAGTYIGNVNNVGGVGLRCTIASSLFDESSAGALILDNSEVKIISSTAFGGPPEGGTAMRGLSAKNGSKVTLIGSRVLGYGAAEVRNGAQTDATSILKVLADSSVTPGGAGSGIALANAGQTFKDASSTITGTVTGNAVVNL
ncbi:MAG TPA: hypothetical protein VF638_00975 [Sphingomonas sp.]|jgi:hypothetical protein